jgi:hypothetical protein
MVLFFESCSEASAAKAAVTRHLHMEMHELREKARQQGLDDADNERLAELEETSGLRMKKERRPREFSVADTERLAELIEKIELQWQQRIKVKADVAKKARSENKKA